MDRRPGPVPGQVFMIQGAGGCTDLPHVARMGKSWYLIRLPVGSLQMSGRCGQASFSQMPGPLAGSPG
jgi:phosphoribosylcarboxyaminoimidazole (NCAIR) mutase